MIGYAQFRPPKLAVKNHHRDLEKVVMYLFKQLRLARTILNPKLNLVFTKTGINVEFKVGFFQCNFSSDLEFSS